MKRYLGIMCALAVGLAACGGSGTRIVTRTVTQPATSKPPTTATTSQTTTAATTPTTTTGTTTTTTAAGTQLCVAHDLALSFLGQQGAAGHGIMGFALKNTSSSPCHTYGYPGILFLARDGSALVTIPHRTTIDFAGHVPETELVMAPGEEASFRLTVTHGAIPGSICTTAYGLQVIPPDDVSSVRTQITDGAYECRDATVTPLQAGTAAYPG